MVNILMPKWGTTLNVLLLLIVLTPVANSQQTLYPPNRTDIMAAYCIPILKHGINKLQSFIDSGKPGRYGPYGPYILTQSKNLIDRENQTLNRILNYLLIRESYIDPAALTLAIERGERDWTEVGSESENCLHSSNMKERQTCYQHSPSIMRASKCIDAKFLPF